MFAASKNSPQSKRNIINKMNGILIGGGELKTHETLPIDEYIVKKAKVAAGERRACGLFLPTASHDCMPYYNTFHKVYTGILGVKTDVLLCVNREVDLDKAREKFEKADFIYVGGGNTLFMLEEWERKGLLPLISEFIASGKLVAGLSAGAICWFEEMYTDSYLEGEYAVCRGLGILKGKISPHYNERTLDFDEILRYNHDCAWGIENNAALEIEDGKPVRAISCGGKAYYLDGSSGTVVKTEFSQ